MFGDWLERNVQKTISLTNTVQFGRVNQTNIQQ